MSDERWQRLRARTFRWNDGISIEGYLAAEVASGRVTWFAWSHVHGNGRTEFGAQSREALLANGPPVAVPKAILEEILGALDTSDAAKDV